MYEGDAYAYSIMALKLALKRCICEVVYLHNVMKYLSAQGY